ncbi:DUF554 domain-containing protein [Stenotrophomonas sp. MMGLT7]|uniref:DUF554 domain-containing protein n=1 Tax=Stenotrophomonas sp. MMGLT7 TaxID=2901227 RepID=UPI001E475FA1|nr:DUF554 domain-containing protein [Stenotrophomonas sp. MMGLT7]MCD7099660.1 DUF554 domain-containing protein [Stenotrophomonas sp. MMGLT7]
MLVGPYVNGAATLVGAIAGAALANKLPERLRTSLAPFFGIPSMVMAVVMIMKLSHLQVVVLSGIVGLIIGELIYLEKGIGKAAASTRGVIDRLLPVPKGELTQEQFLEKFVAITVLFCASGTGIFGAMHEGMTGDSSILVTKSILDFFTSMIFATALGYSVATIAIPQVAIQLALAFSAVLIVPLTTPIMQADFSAVGGLLMLATGFRICGIKAFPVANLIPALVIAMPLSALWTRYIG